MATNYNYTNYITNSGYDTDDTIDEEEFNSKTYRNMRLLADEAEIKEYESARKNLNVLADSIGIGDLVELKNYADRGEKVKLKDDEFNVYEIVDREGLRYLVRDYLDPDLLISVYSDNIIKIEKDDDRLLKLIKNLEKQQFKRRRKPNSRYKDYMSAPNEIKPGRYTPTDTFFRGRRRGAGRSYTVLPRKYEPVDTYSSDEFESDSDEYSDDFEEDYSSDEFEEDEEDTVPFKVKKYLNQPYTGLSKKQKILIEKVYNEKPELLTWSFAETVVPGNRNNALKNLKREMGQDNEAERPLRPARVQDVQPLERPDRDPDMERWEPRFERLYEGGPLVLVDDERFDAINIRNNFNNFFPEVDVPVDAPVQDLPPDPGPLRRQRAGGIILPGDELNENIDFPDRLRQEDVEEFFRPRNFNPQANNENAQMNRENNLNAKNEFDTFMDSVDKGVKEKLKKSKEEDDLRASGFYDEDDDDWPGL